MILVQHLDPTERYRLAKSIADSFKDNAGFLLWGDGSEEREVVLTDFFDCILSILIANQMVYATSEQYEGICAFWTKRNGIKPLQKLKLLGLAKLFPIRRLVQIAKQSARIRRADSFMKSEEDYVFVFMIVVREPYRHQGYMRQLMEFILSYAADRSIPCVLETDSLRNEQIYRHYGMHTLSVQPLSQELTYYILAYK
ncbi:GNAT family N-acetyltransferase [Paenibacillus sp. MER 180]|uniref:GNAT family N-acetyltransferase n=1 Tax=unclassified Paenibacillus TaxID=185978 RepID=UPI00080651FF|nr:MULTISPECIES: GNAT family N-acetyltransferase [unclassified Paenibacillus]MCM3293389.1 GNAT family N-acetyltransferase [Paenibacillus sp. MER 180]OBY80732.1 hypothetical protein BBG47_04550 [Paenibacillus sp. KS1]